MTTRFSNLSNRANVQLPSERGAESIYCSFEGMQGQCINLMAPERLTPRTALTVEYSDSLFLGEVIACAHNCDDTWHVEVKVEQILTGLQSLITLRQRLLGEELAVSPKIVPLFVSA